MFADYIVTLERTQALVVEHGRATAETVASRTPLQEIRDAIHMFEKGSCYMPERMWFAERVAELGTLPECAPWATLFAATRQWNTQQIEARDVWRARWVDRVRGGWNCRLGMEPDGYEEAVAEAMAERQRMINERLAFHSNVTRADVAAMSQIEYIDMEYIPHWVTYIPDWLRRGYCDGDGSAGGGAVTRLPSQSSELEHNDEL